MPTGYTISGPSDVLAEFYQRTPVVQYAGGQKVKVSAGRYFCDGAAVFIPYDVTLDIGDFYRRGQWMAGRDWVVRVNPHGSLTLEYLYPGSPGEPAPEDITQSTVFFNGRPFRCLGGFHTLCADIGGIPGHPLSGLRMGDILPASVWSVNFRPLCGNPTGMVYCSEAGIWVDIYSASGSTVKPESRFGRRRLCFTAKTEFMAGFLAVGKRLPTMDEFVAAAAGSNCGTTVNGWLGSFVTLRDLGYGNEYEMFANPANDVTGGHSDTEGRRMVSNIGCEEMCGLQDQYLSDLIATGGTVRLVSHDDIAGKDIWSQGDFGSEGSAILRYPEGSVNGTRMFMATSMAGGSASSDLRNLDFPDGNLGSCGPMAVKAQLTPYIPPVPGNYDESSLKGFKKYRKDLVDGIANLGTTFFQDSYGVNAGAISGLNRYFTGARGCSECARFPKGHQYISPFGYSDDYVWLDNVTGYAVMVSINSWGSGTGTEARVTPSSVWEPIHSYRLEPGRTMMIRAKTGVVKTTCEFTVDIIFEDQDGNGIAHRVTRGMNIGGNIMSLLCQGTREFSSEDSAGAFYNLFANGGIGSASELELPATVLTPYCYGGMFEAYFNNDDSDTYHADLLKSLPDLPATTLADGAYAEMFAYSSKFTRAMPSLPALTAPNNCYQRMFYQCKALTEPPAIKATKFGTYACESMFRYCVNLDRVPVIRADSALPESACRYMFDGCASLDFSIRLPSSGDPHIYRWSLEELSSGIDAPTALEYMLPGVNEVERDRNYWFTNPPVS